jgi:RNA polymerase sigma factor (sigma-70 family)
MQDRPFPFGRAHGSIAGVTEPEFATLVTRHRTELHRHCARLLGSPADAEDALQETLLRAWRSRLKVRVAPRAWLYRIATHACFDLAARRRPATEIDGAPEPAAPHDEQPDALAIANETVELALLSAAAHLPRRQCACLVMRDVLRWSAEDTAAALEISVAAGNSTLQRARAGLRAQLAADRLQWSCP